MSVFLHVSCLSITCQKNGCFRHQQRTHPQKEGMAAFTWRASGNLVRVPSGCWWLGHTFSHTFHCWACLSDQEPNPSKPQPGLMPFGCLLESPCFLDLESSATKMVGAIWADKSSLQPEEADCGWFLTLPRFLNLCLTTKHNDKNATGWWTPKNQPQEAEMSVSRPALLRAAGSPFLRRALDRRYFVQHTTNWKFISDRPWWYWQTDCGIKCQ